MSDSDDLREAVDARANSRCEYCLMHQSLQGATFHLEHIQPQSLGGLTELDNLALACPGCNLYKSDRLEAVDPESGESVALFHPRQHAWDAHFTWNGHEIVGRTEHGRATIAAFDLNSERRIRVRHAEEYFSLFPPGE